MSVHVKVAGAWQEIGVDAAAGGGMTWAKVSGGTVTTVNNPDGSVDEVHKFTANGTLTVESPGYAEVLVAGCSANGGVGMGNGGRLRVGMHSLPAGALPVTVALAPDGNGLGVGSALGTVVVAGTTGVVPNSSNTTGAGGLVFADRLKGVVSNITGAAVEYAQGNAVATPGSLGQPGIVIVRVKTTPPTVSGVVASGGTESTYVGDGVNGVLGQTYREHKFTANGSLNVSVGGMAEVLVVGSGGWGGDGNREPGGSGGGGGGVEVQQIVLSVGAADVVIGASSTVPTSPGSWLHDSGGAIAFAHGGGRGGAQAATGNAGGCGGGANGPTLIPAQGKAGNANRGGAGAGAQATADMAGEGKLVWGTYYGGGGGSAWQGPTAAHPNGGGANGAPYEGNPGTAVPNSGGGGGGGFYGSGGGATGVVRVRYPIA